MVVLEVRQQSLLHAAGAGFEIVLLRTGNFEQDHRSEVAQNLVDLRMNGPAIEQPGGSGQGRAPSA